MIIGLTGGIATGKSTVSNILASLGAYVIDADKIAHNILDKSNEAYKEVVDEFGQKILNNNNKISRKKLGEIVFFDNEKLEKLENITHPYIIKKIKAIINEKKEDFEYIVLDAPLLFETGLEELVDLTWVIAASYDGQLERIKKRDNLKEKEAKKRISAQMSLSKKKELADNIIYNNDTFKKLKSKVLIEWKKINNNKI